MKDFTAKPLTETLYAGLDVVALAQAIERLSMVAGLEQTEDAATFLLVCEGHPVDPSRLSPLLQAGLTDADGCLTAQGIAVRAWLGFHPTGLVG